VSLIESVVAFGKIFFIPKDESIPPLPEMSLLFLRNGDEGDFYRWRAACIDLEMDASGTSIKNAAINLKKCLLMYIDLEREAAKGSIVEAAKIITKNAFSKSRQKKEYFDTYRQAKEKYFMQAIEEEKRRQEKLRIEKEAFNQINDAVWKKIMAAYLPQPGKNVPGQPVSVMPQRKTAAVPAVDQNWALLYTPSNSSRIPAELWGDHNLENLKRGPSGLLLRQLAYNG
jgi:hypothetical protein